MQAPLSLDNQTLVATPGSNALLPSLAAKRSARGLIAIPIINGGARAEAEVTDLLLKFIAKLPERYDSTPIVSVTDFVWNADRLQYEAVYDWEANTTLNVLFGVQSAAITISGGVAATDLISTSAPHQLIAGLRVWFPSLEGGTGLTAAEGTWYYVIASGLTTTDFKVSETLGGSAKDFTTAITAGSVRADPEDISSVDLAIEVGYRFDPGDPWTSSENDVELALANNYLRNTDGAPEDPGDTASELWLDDRAVRFDKAQTLSATNMWQAFANLGWTYSASLGGITITLADGSHAFIPLTTVPS